MSADEESALRYVAGYMIKSLRTKTEKSNLNFKEEMVLALYSFREAASEMEQGSEGEQAERVKLLTERNSFLAEWSSTYFYVQLKLS